MVMQLHKRVKLTDCLQTYTNHENERCTAEEHCNISREVEELLYQSRNQSDECKKKRTGQNDSVENLSKILLHISGLRLT